MVATKYAVIYSKTTGRIRWELHPDSDSALDNLRVHPGEAIEILKIGEVVHLPELQIKISTKCGKVPTDDTYAIVDKAKGEVVSIVTADPTCGDTVPATMEMVKSKVAKLGDIYDKTAGSFTTPKDPKEPK